MVSQPPPATIIDAYSSAGCGWKGASIIIAAKATVAPADSASTPTLRRNRGKNPAPQTAPKPMLPSKPP